ncbi:unnamed protein product [Camellia sinensis]
MESWTGCINWWGLSWVLPRSIPELLSWWYGHNFQHLAKIVWEVIPLTILWTLWLARNEKVFSQKEPNWADLTDLVKERTAIWVKYLVNLTEYSDNDFIFSSEGIKPKRINAGH